jgi:hypothetical protein
MKRKKVMLITQFADRQKKNLQKPVFLSIKSPNSSRASVKKNCISRAQNHIIITIVYRSLMTFDVMGLINNLSYIESKNRHMDCITSDDTLNVVSNCILSADTCQEINLCE